MNSQRLDIPNYEGLYSITRHGDVYSTPRNGKRSRILKQEVVKSSVTSYRRVTLSKNGQTKRFQVHRLVALLYISNPLNLPIVNHLDNNGENNNSTNLEWCTQAQNIQHSVAQGRHLQKCKRAAIIKLASSIVATTSYGKMVFSTNYVSCTGGSKSTITFICKCGTTTTKRVDGIKCGKYGTVCGKCASTLRGLTRIGHTSSIAVPVAQYNLKNEHIADYNSITEASKATGSTNINSVLNGTYKQSKGFLWKLIN